MRLDWATADDLLMTPLYRYGDADPTSCSDLLDDFLKRISAMENEYWRAMADLYRAS